MRKKNSNNLTQTFTQRLAREHKLYDQYVASLAHDLRTPLTAAKMAAQIILLRPENIEKNKNIMERLVKNIDRMDQMIKNLLDASKMGSEVCSDLKMDECDMRSIVMMTLKELGFSCSNPFLLEIDREKINGFWNEESIRRVVENLINNAIKYGRPQSLIKIIVKQKKDMVFVAVHNEGNPIPKVEQKNIFKPFYQTSKKEKMGWGLGLPLVERVIHAHGGRVKLKSSKNNGTSFIVNIPKDSRIL